MDGEQGIDDSLTGQGQRRHPGLVVGGLRDPVVDEARDVTDLQQRGAAGGTHVAPSASHTTAAI